MIEYKGKQFENNPNAVSPNTQFEGLVYLKYASEPCISVYGFTMEQVIEVAKKFQEVEPKAGVVEIYGPYDFLCIRREYVDTHVMF